MACQITIPPLLAPCSWHINHKLFFVIKSHPACTVFSSKLLWLLTFALWWCLLIKPTMQQFLTKQTLFAEQTKCNIGFCPCLLPLFWSFLLAVEWTIWTKNTYPPSDSLSHLLFYYKPFAGAFLKESFWVFLWFKSQKLLIEVLSVFIDKDITITHIFFTWTIIFRSIVFNYTSSVAAALAHARLQSGGRASADVLFE